MKTIHAIYERGVFRPTEPVDLPEGTEVEIPPPASCAVAGAAPSNGDGLDDIYEVLGRRFRSGHHDTAARHDEHQP